jgi:beta-mannosidase
MTPIVNGWQAASGPPGERLTADDLGDSAWMPATVPGTVAGALRAAGLEAGDLDAEDWWFRTTFSTPPAGPGEEIVLRFEGIATLAEVFLNGRSIVSSESMFQAHAVDIGNLVAPGDNMLAIRCRALTPELAKQRRPRARWRTRLVADNNLRWFRTMLLGRIPSFSPRPAAVGPWGPITLERRSGVIVEDLRLRPRLDGSVGVLAVTVRLRVLGGERPTGIDVVLDGPGEFPFGPGGYYAFYFRGPDRLKFETGDDAPDGGYAHEGGATSSRPPVPGHARGPGQSRHRQLAQRPDHHRDCQADTLDAGV